MKDERLDDLMQHARDSYRVPPSADLDAIWSRIESEHFDAPSPLAPVVLDGRAIRPYRRRSWLMPAASIAATLLVGVGIGRVTAPASVTTPATVVVAPVVAPVVVPVVSPLATPATAPREPLASNVAEPLQRLTYEYVARTVALLDSLPTARLAQLGGDPRFVANASQLLGTTRLLLDSPAATDPRLRHLLEDLELVLAQVANLRTAPRADELTFIAEAMNERDVVPRLRTVAASYTAAGY